MSHSTLPSLFRYKAWADGELLDALATLDPQQHPEAHHTALRIFNHIHVVDAIFKGNLLGEPHGFRATNTPETPTLDMLRTAIHALDAWYLDYVASLDPLANSGTQLGADHGAHHGQDHRRQLKPRLGPEQHGHQHIEADDPEHQPEPAADLLVSGLAFDCHLIAPVPVSLSVLVRGAPWRLHAKLIGRQDSKTAPVWLPLSAACWRFDDRVQKTATFCW
nr:DinB family protein [Aeromonas caviae]